jgi:hypothetical protein
MPLEQYDSPPNGRLPYRRGHRGRLGARGSSRSWLELTEDTGSALVAKTDDADLSFWAFERFKIDGTWNEALREEGYRPLREIDGIAVFSDGIRLTWENWRLLVWMAGAPTGALSDIS